MRKTAKPFKNPHRKAGWIYLMAFQKVRESQGPSLDGLLACHAAGAEAVREFFVARGLPADSKHVRPPGY